MTNPFDPTPDDLARIDRARAEGQAPEVEP